MMATITIHVSILDDKVDFLPQRDMIVAPATKVEAQKPAVARDAIARSQELTIRALNTLADFANASDGADRKDHRAIVRAEPLRGRAGGLCPRDPWPVGKGWAHWPRERGNDAITACPLPAGKLAVYAQDCAGAGWLDVQRPSGRLFPTRITPFVPEASPAREVVAESRTLKGGGAAGLATIGAAGVEVAQDVLAQTQSAILPLVPYLDTLRWMFTVLENALEGAFREGIKAPPEPPVSPTAHRRAHRPGALARPDPDPEGRAFVTARLDRLNFKVIATAVAARVLPAGHVGKSAIHDW